MNLATTLNAIISRSLSEAEAREAALVLMTGEAPPAQVGSLLTALRLRGETGQEILGFARALREKAAAFPLASEGLVDTCGTGGDGLATLNVSTLAGFVAAAAGVKVAKHGNRAVSSRCGSADLLEGLGVKIDVSPESAARCLEVTGFAFLLAPRYHQTLRHVAPIRRELGFRSIFNLVGPLANPARTRRQVLGVPTEAHLRPVAEALQALGAEHGMVVHGSDGSDEITLCGPTRVFEVTPEGLEEKTIHPSDAGLQTCSPEALKGGDVAANVRIAHTVLSGEDGPAFDVVVLNAAAALVVGGKVESLREGADLARETLRSGKARAVLDRLVHTSSEAA